MASPTARISVLSVSAQQFGGLGEGLLIDRGLGLARLDHRLAQLLVSCTERSRAEDQPGPRSTTRSVLRRSSAGSARQRRKFGPVVVHRLHFRRSAIRADDEMRLLRTHALHCPRSRNQGSSCGRRYVQSGTACCAISSWVTSPEATTASYASRGRPSLSSCCTTDHHGRGALRSARPFHPADGRRRAPRRPPDRPRRRVHDAPDNVGENDVEAVGEGGQTIEDGRHAPSTTRPPMRQVGCASARRRNARKD